MLSQEIDRFFCPKNTIFPLFFAIFRFFRLRRRKYRYFLDFGRSRRTPRDPPKTPILGRFSSILGRSRTRFSGRKMRSWRAKSEVPGSPGSGPRDGIPARDLACQVPGLGGSGPTVRGQVPAVPRDAGGSGFRDPGVPGQISGRTRGFGCRTGGSCCQISGRTRVRARVARDCRWLEVALGCCGSASHCRVGASMTSGGMSSITISR